MLSRLVVTVCVWLGALGCWGGCSVAIGTAWWGVIGRLCRVGRRLCGFYGVLVGWRSVGYGVLVCKLAYKFTGDD